MVKIGQRRIRFFYNEGWTRWYDDEDDSALLDMALVSDQIKAVEIQEMLTREEFEQRYAPIVETGGPMAPAILVHRPRRA